MGRKKTVVPVGLTYLITFKRELEVSMYIEETQYDLIGVNLKAVQVNHSGLYQISYSTIHRAEHETLEICERKIR